MWLTFDFYVGWNWGIAIRLSQGNKCDLEEEKLEIQYELTDNVFLYGRTVRSLRETFRRILVVWKFVDKNSLSILKISER